METNTPQGCGFNRGIPENWTAKQSPQTGLQNLNETTKCPLLVLSLSPLTYGRIPTLPVEHLLYDRQYPRALYRCRHTLETLQVQFQTTAIGEYHNKASHTNFLVFQCLQKLHHTVVYEACNSIMPKKNKVHTLI